MREETRGQDPFPGAEDEEWLATNPLGLVLRALALASVAIALGIGAAVLLDATELAPQVLAPASR